MEDEKDSGVFGDMKGSGSICCWLVWKDLGFRVPGKERNMETEI